MESTLYVWPLYGIMVTLLIVLGFAQVKFRSNQLSDTKIDVRVFVKAMPDTSVRLNETVKQKLIRRNALRAALPFFLSVPIWTVWIVLFGINQNASLTFAVFTLAVLALGYCLGQFVNQVFLVRGLQRSHIGTQRHASFSDEESEQ